jgi:hypothetical protein
LLQSSQGNQAGLRVEVEAPWHDVAPSAGAPDHDGLPDDGRIGAERALPDFMRQDHDGIGAWPILLGRKDTTPLRVDAQDVEHAGGHERRVHPFRAIPFAEVHRAGRVRGDARKRARVFLEVEILRR